MSNMYKLHVQKGVTERINAMQETHHAAVFMGEDLNVPPDTPGVSDGGKSLFDDDKFIDIMNINRVINRLYSVKWFPKAVFVTFRQFENDTMINRFCDTHNSALLDTTTHSHPESAHQKLCRTGRLSDTDLACTLIKFTKDIHSPMIMKMRTERLVPQ